MATKCADCPLRQAGSFVPMTQDEVEQTQSFKKGELQIAAGSQILAEGTSAPQLYSVLKGTGLRFKLLPDGQRQVVNFVFPGDFLGLQSGVMGEMKHSVVASTDMTLCVFERSDLFSFFAKSPERGFDVTWLAAVEEYFLGEALTTLGQRSAESAIAWALLKLYRRGESVGLASDGRMRLPFKQQDLADALGLSLVHTNKTLSKLRSRQIVSWKDGTLQILSVDDLQDCAMDHSDGEVRRPII